MAYESHYWRQLIKKEVRHLEKMLKLSHKDIDKDVDKHFSEIEIKLMTLAYVIRKLADTNKLPDNTLLRKVKLKQYPRIETFRRRFYVDIEREWDLSSKEESVLTLREISNQIIHSYVLQAIGTSKRAFKCVWFVSDRKKDDFLYEIEIKNFLKELLIVADSHVVEMRSIYDRDKKVWIVTKK